RTPAGRSLRAPLSGTRHGKAERLVFVRPRRTHGLDRHTTDDTVRILDRNGEVEAQLLGRDFGPNSGAWLRLRSVGIPKKRLRGLTPRGEVTSDLDLVEPVGLIADDIGPAELILALTLAIVTRHFATPEPSNGSMVSSKSLAGARQLS